MDVLTRGLAGFATILLLVGCFGDELGVRSGGQCAEGGLCPMSQICVQGENICRRTCTNPLIDPTTQPPDCECCGPEPALNESDACDLDHVCRRACMGGPPVRGQCDSATLCPSGQRCDSLNRVCRPACTPGTASGCPMGQTCVTDAFNGCTLCRPNGQAGMFGQPCGMGCDTGLQCDSATGTCQVPCGVGEMRCGPFGNCPLGFGCEVTAGICRPSCISGCEAGSDCQRPAQSSCSVCVPHATGPIVLADTLSGPRHIAIDAANVYWTEIGSGNISKCAIAGCANTPTVIASHQGAPVGIAVDSDNVYYMVGSSLRSCALGGCTTPTMLGTGTQTTGGGLAVSGGTVYWSAGNVFSCPVSGCGGSPTVLGPPVTEFLAFEGSLVWGTSNGSLFCLGGSCGGSPTTLTTNAGQVLGIAIDGNDVYWTNPGSGSVEHCSLAGCTTPDIMASARTNPHSIIADASFVYWTEPDQGLIMKCARTGCANAPVPFVDGLGNPYALAIDDQNLYWTDRGNVVMKMAK